MSDSNFDDPETLFALELKLLAFREVHPELAGAFGMWMADRSTCEVMHPEGAEILAREMPEFASDA